MKRDIQLERKLLFEIEDKYEAGQGWLYDDEINIEGYARSVIAEHCKLLRSQGLINDYKEARTISGNFDYQIGNLSARGYDYLEMIRNEKTWEKSLKQAEEKELPKTVENIAKIIGIITGNTLKEMSGLP